MSTISSKPDILFALPGLLNFCTTQVLSTKAKRSAPITLDFPQKKIRIFFNVCRITANTPKTIVSTQTDLNQLFYYVGIKDMEEV